MKTQLPKLHVLTLGCSKNTVDSESLMAQARANDFLVTEEAKNADVLMINTCGFIEEAKQESINHILAGVELKKKGDLKKLLVMGCLSERYKRDLEKEIPDVDRYFGTIGLGGEVLTEIMRELGGEYKHQLLGERTLTTPKHFAYLKISEGCDNPCSFCAIPLMRGGHKTKPIEFLENEARSLKAKGVRELILIGQDLTYYGLDLYGKRLLDELLKRLSDIGFDWIRLLYAYPAKFPEEILSVIRERENICKYLDMPIQHINDSMLKSMRRGITKKRTIELIETIRAEVPGIRLRTTLILGYPNETEEIFEEVKEFVSQIAFDRLGCFSYSHEDNTSAFELTDNIPLIEKKRRVKEVMEIQERISKEKNEQLIGSKMKVLIDRIENGVAYGRTEFDTPEVDNEVILQSAEKGFEMKSLAEGAFYEVEITDCEPFDLFGEIKRKL
ncbi:MAG: 30S ribosomal protein S12 methylthiotransferase RimO [Chloroherpetonaceae bacterium]|nr:30S ribosomal protein S12 methylthiotransferase RimO [Chloroherpetonaceae bacterium]